MAELILPPGVDPEPVDPQDETKEMVSIINDFRVIHVDDQELKRAQKDVQRKSTMIITKAEVEVAIQKQLAGWANWFAMFNPRMPKTVGSALAAIGYQITKVENNDESVH